MSDRPSSRIVLALVVIGTIGLLSGGSTAGAGQAAISGFDAEDVDHGDTTQTIHVGGRLPGGTTSLAVDVTPLADAGVGLSSASAEVETAPRGLSADAKVARRGDAMAVDVDLEPSDGPTAFRLTLRLEGLETTGASQTWLRYDVTVDGRSSGSDRFRLEPPAVPDIGTSVESDPLVLGRPDESQRLRLAVVESPPGTPVQLLVDLSPLREAGVSFATTSVNAAVTEGDATIDRVARNGSIATIEGVTGDDGRTAIVLTLSGLDTQGAEPAGGLRLPVTVEAPAGTKTVESAPFGLYRPGDAPTPTETIAESPTATETDTASPTPTVNATSTSVAEPDAGQPGFTAAATLLSLVVGHVLVRRRRS